jgi:molybdopterin converting factor subunit 1
MKINIALFGITRDIIGHTKYQTELEEGTTVGELLTHLIAQYPRLGDISTLLVAVNDEYADSSQIIEPTDQVALIPPVSGG